MANAKKGKGLKNLKGKQAVKSLEADSVRGGDGKVTSGISGRNVHKVANKAADAIDGYIRS